MKADVFLLFFFALNTFAASNVVEKVRILEEKPIQAHSCSVTGDYTDNLYGNGYLYTVTMKITAEQKVEIYSVQIKKGLRGKTIEIEIPNSTQAPSERTAESSQSITYPVRYPGEHHRLALMKICDDEMVFINTGAYPPPPPRPVPPEPASVTTPPNPPDETAIRPPEETSQGSSEEIDQPQPNQVPELFPLNPILPPQ